MNYLYSSWKTINFEYFPLVNVILVVTLKLHFSGWNATLYNMVTTSITNMYIYYISSKSYTQTYFSRRWLFFVHILYGTFIMSSADMSGMNWDGTNVMLLHIDNNFTSFRKWKLHFTSIAFWRKSIIVISNSCENYINFYHILLTIPSFYMSFYTIHICYITIIKELHTLR